MHRLSQNDLLSVHCHKTLNIVADGKQELCCSQHWQPKGYLDSRSNILSVPKATSHLHPLKKSIFKKRTNRADRHPLSQYFTVPHLIRTDSAQTPSWPRIPSGVRVKS